MKKNSLTPNKGLSLSQATSISNLCNQRAGEISAKLNGVNNYKKTVDVNNGVNVKTHITVVGKPLPENVVALLTEKSELHACQAFLMENIKAKDDMLKEIKSASADISSVEVPERPKTVSPLINQLPAVIATEGKEWGWSQLTTAEINEYLQVEAFASHVGQFIHEDSPLDRLRKELGKGIAPIEWMTINDGMKSPIEVTVHESHTPEKLLKLHEELAALHRKHEQRVNYFKAKVKNLTTEENARIAKINADAQNDAAKQNNDANAVYETAAKAYNEKVRNIQADFETARQASIKEVAAMRIQIDPRFQDTINLFMKQISEVQE